MSDSQTAEAAGTEAAAQTTADQDAGKASWDELFKGEDPAKVRKSLDHSREWEKRAKENAKAAERLAEIENANKSDAEKAAAKIAELQADAASARVEALRFKVASQYGIDGDRAELLLTGSDEETMTRQAKALKQESDERKKQGNRVPSEGTNPQAKPDEMREFTRNLFDKAD